MDFLTFRNRFFELGCFSTNQVLAWYPAFQPNNLSRWSARRLILRLRQGYFSFPEYLEEPSFAYYVSNYIYKPSYVSTYTALAFYGLIPEAVPQTTAVSTLKTASFQDDFGVFSYQRVKPELLFGYEQKPLGPRTLAIASPEKALLDLLYLHPSYNSADELAELRLDQGFMRDELDWDKLTAFAEQFGNKRLLGRVKLVRSVYHG